MKELPLIEATYIKLANLLDAEFESARTQSDMSATTRIQRQQLVNDSAYFVLAWGQLEAKINDECAKAIARRKSSPSWDIRRAWDAHNENDLRLRFEDRLALLLDRTNVVSDAYRRTVKLYGQRNLVAHGKSLATGIDVPTIIGELYQIASELRT